MVYTKDIKINDILRAPKQTNNYIHARTDEPIECCICGKKENLVDDIQYRFCIPVFGVAKIEIKPRYWCKRCYDELKFDE